MNALFLYLFILSSTVLLFQAPENYLSCLLSGGTSAASLCVALLSSYALWLGLMRVWEESGLTRAVSRLLRPIVKKVFAVEKEETTKAICMNLSANILGIGGVATPYGVQSASLLDGEKHSRYSSSMLFVVNASSLQLIPTTLVAMRTSLHSHAPFDIILPTLISTVLSTCLAVLLVRIFIPKDGEKARIRPLSFSRKRVAGVQL